MKRVMVLAALPVAAAAVLFSGCRKGDATNDAQAPAVTLGATDVAAAARTTLTGGVPLSGPLSPKVNVTVGSPIAEQITAMLVSEGDPVQPGQPIARFRDDVLRAAAASATADAANARMAVTLAVAESSRAEALFGEGAIAKRDHDNAILGAEAARARQALAQSQLASATDRLETATLKAPVAGIVSQRFAQAGDRVDFGKPVLVIVDNSVLQLEASVEAQWLPELRVGRQVRLTVTGMSGDTLFGRISRINPTADPATRQVRIYVDIPNGGRRLVGGLFVSGEVVINESRAAVAVPQAAVRHEGVAQEPIVYVIAQGKIVRRPVRTGITDTGRGLIEVRGGLAPGDTVVVGPVEGLAEGMRVDIASHDTSSVGN
jgi:membrane fusion protein, multidrug efflux system